MNAFSNRNIGRLLGCSRPVVLAGMGGVARSELVAAITRAGGFGFLGMVREPAALISSEVMRLRELGIERFGVNIIPAATSPDLLMHQVQTIIALEVPAVTLFWDIDAHLIANLREAGVLVIHQVGSAEEALAAEQAGAQAVIAQGREAGGHVRGDTPLQALLPAVVEAVAVPVIAAGGLSTGSDLVAALALGAEGIALGTAFLAAEESFAHTYHKQRLLKAKAEDTLLTDIFHINWPAGAAVRVLASAVTEGLRGSPQDGTFTPIGSEGHRPIYLFSTDSPLRGTTGDLESMALYAGTGVGNVTEIRSAAAILDEIIAEAGRLLAQADPSSESTHIEPSSAVCYAGEAGGDYMGMLEASDVEADVLALVDCVAALMAQFAPAGDCEPPFSRELVELAPWLVALRSLFDRTDRPTRWPPDAVLDLTGRIGLLAARISDASVREALVGLRRAAENVSLNK